MSPFQPVGDKARWRVVYELLRKAPVGGIVTYEQLGEALGLDPADERQVIQMAVRRAAKEHEEADKRALDVVPNTGYVIVPAQEHLRLARKHQKRSSRSLARGHSKVTNVDLSGLDPDARHAFEVVARAFAMQMDFNKRFDVRQSKLEEAVDAMSQHASRTDDEIRELKERLAKLERGE
jgi:alkylated DNA nucleotide flippase Atl1